MPHNQALQLFRRHAFLENDRASIATDLVDRCLAYCDGLPLGLVVFGSLLRNREEHHWRSMLKLLERQGLCKEIDKLFRISLDELDHNAGEIFLAIAFSFKGKSRREIENAMDAHGFQTSLGIEMLLTRSLITIVEDTTFGLGVERVGMHPLLQLMGQNIINHECQDEPGKKHNRPWVCIDAYSRPSRRMGTNTVKQLTTRSHRGLCWNTVSGYSTPKTPFIQPRKLKASVSTAH
ncbi:hypothetical protein MLD38_003199 [Melastoma candidum]|uniref:Uncharacterized protein n=1 Tax=Melastoma candidum TaxID=119954 RepID=A0ACB9S1B8_9MYRT|nr:hypothetical protein MLD38_003199 [Melastoma candidum]